MRLTIRSVEGLAKLNARQAVVRFRVDFKMPWEFAKLDGLECKAFQRMGEGYSAAHELTSNRVHVRMVFTERGFSEGLEVQVATASEIRGKKWSYQNP